VADATLEGYADLLDNTDEKVSNGSAPKIATVFEPNPELDGYNDILQAPMVQNESASKRSREPVPGWQSGFKAFTDRLTIGGASANKASAGWMLAAGGDMKEAQDMVNTQAVLEAQEDTEDYINTHAHQQLFRLRDLPGWNQKDNSGMHMSDLPGWLIESIPSLGQAGAGMFYGGLAGSVFGVGGIAVGAFIGGAAATGMTIFGSHVYDQMQRGVPKDAAILGGALSGTIGGVASTIGFGVLGKSIPSVSRAMLNSPTFREASAKVFGIMGKSLALDLGANETQALLETSTKYLETLVTHPTNPYTMQDALSEFTMASIQGAVLAGTLSTAGTTAGVTAGMKARTMQMHIESKMHEFTAQQAAKEAADNEKDISRKLEVSGKLAGQVEQDQAASKKKFAKFLNADGAGDVPAAKAAYEQAREDYKNAPEADKANAKLDMDQAKAELEATRFSVRSKAIDEVLTEPDLKGRLADQAKYTKGEIEKFDSFIADMESRGVGPDHAAMKYYEGQKSEAEAQMRMIKQLQGLASEDIARDKLKAMKAALEANVEKTVKDAVQLQLKKRLRDRAKDIDALRGEIRADKAEASLEGAAAKTAKRRDKLADLRDEQQIDTELQGLIEDGGLTGMEARELAPKVKTSRMLQLAEMAKNKVDQAATLSAGAKKKAIKAARKLAISLIDASRLPAADKTKLKSKLGTDDLTDLAGTIDKLYQDIDKIFGKRRFEAALKDLKNQIESLDFDPTKPSQYPEVEPLLILFKGFYKDHELVAKFLAEIDQTKEPDIMDMAKLELVALFDKPVKEMSLAEVQKLHDTLVELKTTGTAKALANYTKRKERQAAKIKTFAARIAPNAKNKSRLTDATVNNIRRLFDDSVNAQMSSWRGLMMLTSQWGQFGDMVDVFDVKSAHSTFQEMRLQWEHRLKELTKGDMTDKEWARYQRSGERRAPVLEYEIDIKDELTGEIIRETRELSRPDGKGHTYQELVQIRNLLLDKDGDAISRLSKGNEYSYASDTFDGTTTLQAVVDHLDEALPNWQQAADGLRKFYREFGSVVNEATVRRFGRELVENKTYGGQLLGYTEVGGRFKEQFRRVTTKPGSLNQRTGGSAPVKIKSAMRNAVDHIAQYSRDLAFHEFEQDAQAVFSDAAVKKMIIHNNGENTYKAITKFIEDIVLGYQRNYSQADNIFAMIRENMYTRFLGLRPEQYIKQMTGVIQALQFISPTELVDGWQYMLANPEKVKADMKESGLYNARAEIRDPDYRPGGRSFLKNFNNSTMLPVQAGDHVSVAGSAYPVYLKVLRETGDKVKAKKAFEMVFDTTQSSGSIDELPGLFRAHSLYRFFTTLSQEPTRQVEAIANARRKYANNPTKENGTNYRNIVGVTFAGAAAYNLMGWLVLSPFMGDEERGKKLATIIAASPLGPYGGVAFFGGLLTSLATSTLGVAINPATKAHEPHLIPTDPLTDLFKFVESWLKVSHEGLDYDNGWNAIIKTSDALGTTTGIPSSNVLKYGKEKR